MTRVHYFASAMLVAGIAYVIALVVSHGNGMVIAVGAIPLVLIVTGWRSFGRDSARRQ